MSKYVPERAHKEVVDALTNLKRLTQVKTQLELWEERAAKLQIPDTDNEYLREWYAPSAPRMGSGMVYWSER